MKTHIALLLSTLFLVASVAAACSDEGTSTKCEPMPLDDQRVAEDEQHSAEVEQWWSDAAADGCATHRTVPVFKPKGAAGAGN